MSSAARPMARFLAVYSRAGPRCGRWATPSLGLLSGLIPGSLTVSVTLTVRSPELDQSLELSDREPLHGYQLRVVQEVLLALLAQSGAHAYELRARLALALGPLAGALNEGQVYVTLGRLEKSGLIASAARGSGGWP